VYGFTLTCRVWGTIHQEVADTLIWRAIPAEHKYTMIQGLIRIEYPAGVLHMTPASLSATGQVLVLAQPARLSR
jgi:hypothetical protein